MLRTPLLTILAFCLTSPFALSQPFSLQPAVAVEAEDFTVESGWKIVKNGQGNYMVDIIGFSHISGERLLSLDAKASTGRAFKDITVPQTGKYRLWVRYEYPPFCETQFRVTVEQSGKKVANQVMGKKTNLRYAALSGKMEPRVQHDPSWGPEGIVEEVFTLNLTAGKARLVLEGVEQPQIPGVSANRNIDLLYLTSDTSDAWLKHYGQTNRLYPILDAVRDTLGPRWEVKFTNRGAKPADFRITHTYNRIPWGFSDPTSVRAVKPGTSTEWLGLRGQDTAHFGMVSFYGSGGDYDVEIRPVGGTSAIRKLSGISPLRIYLPPYPGKGESPLTPEEAINAILAELDKHKAPGKKPTLPLCYGGWMPLGQDNDYGRKYAQLYAALGFRGMHPANSGPAQQKNLEAVGVKAEKSWMVAGYRNPPTKDNITRARANLMRAGLSDKLRFYDYGDEIHFSEWLGMMTADEVARIKAAGKRVTPREILVQRWVEWLRKNRKGKQLKDYWLPSWGLFNPNEFRPDSSAEAARENPRLYIDSLLFYEETAIRFAAQGARAVKSALGEDVLCGANYSGHPFYYPHSTMYIKWFREGAADLGRHSEYFWQVAQPGPMINGYFAEHFMAGMRENPKAVLRQYTMPHSPGNTDASFLRTAFTHLAHGATMLDFFGIGLNETFTENHIDHRAHSRFRALRDVTHCVGFVEDLLPSSRPVPSEVALLISESTERWDLAGIARDQAGHDQFGKDFRKTRLHFHLERLGIWKALTFAGCSPDLVTEEDVIAGKLTGYKVIFVVGDHWPKEMVPALEKWVKQGGVAVGTAASGQKDIYGEAMKSWHELAGIDKIVTQMRSTFIRPRQELPFLSALDTVKWKDNTMPVLATAERFRAVKDVETIAQFNADEAPAWIKRSVGKGTVHYIAAHPGLAFLWSGLYPATVPDRGVNTHTVPTTWDKAARQMIATILDQAGVKPMIESSEPLLDTRILEAPKGYLVPIANYSATIGEKVTLKLRVKKAVTKVRSAYHGDLTFEKNKAGQLVVTVPKLEYGDILRLETK